MEWRAEAFTLQNVIKRFGGQSKMWTRPERVSCGLSPTDFAPKIVRIGADLRGNCGPFFVYLVKVGGYLRTDNTRRIAAQLTFKRFQLSWVQHSNYQIGITFIEKKISK